ncbi:MAG: hypothetical protein EA340_11965 [Nitriliruptor sp.]|nr:MAG: hypothetical protein EA340_11965 [Nitriliruptor sp.]
MRFGVAAWVRLSTLVSLVAFAAMVGMYLTLMLVQGLVWRDGIADPTALHQLLFLALAVPFLALPGVVVGRAVQVTGWRFARIALGSTGLGLGAVLLADASPIAVWAAMVLGTLLGVVWAPTGERSSAASPGGDGNGHLSEERAAASLESLESREAERSSLLLEPPLRRLVPRDGLAPPEGWEVPEGLPQRRRVDARPGGGSTPVVRSETPVVRSDPEPAEHEDDQLTSR